MSGKAIFILGPSFGGKTYLINQLSEDLESVEIINFELFYEIRKDVRKSYSEFIDRVSTGVLAGGIVLAESVGNLLFEKSHTEIDDPLVIIVSPSMEDHMRNYNKYFTTFGLASTVRRSGGHGVFEMRRNFNSSLCNNINRHFNKFLLYNGKNYEEILEETKNFLFDLDSTVITSNKTMCKLLAKNSQ